MYGSYIPPRHPHVCPRIRHRGIHHAPAMTPPSVLRRVVNVGPEGIRPPEQIQPTPKMCSMVRATYLVRAGPVRGRR